MASEEKDGLENFTELLNKLDTEETKAGIEYIRKNLSEISSDKKIQINKISKNLLDLDKSIIESIDKEKYSDFLLEMKKLHINVFISFLIDIAPNCSKHIKLVKDKLTEKVNKFNSVIENIHLEKIKDLQDAESGAESDA
jgi:hypothetical protein